MINTIMKTIGIYLEKIAINSAYSASMACFCEMNIPKELQEAIVQKHNIISHTLMVDMRYLAELQWQRRMFRVL